MGTPLPNNERCNTVGDVFSHKGRLHLVSCGYLRKYFNTKNANPKDIAKIIESFLYVDWKFNYFGDYINSLNDFWCYCSNWSKKFKETSSL